VDLLRVETPVFYPACCFVCRLQTGPLADTGVERYDEHLYLCQRCAFTAARALGGLDAEAAQGLRDLLGEAVRESTQLRIELEHAQANKVVSLADVRTLLDAVGVDANGEKGKTTQPGITVEQYRESIEEGRWRTCSATKKDGTPCTADALSGRDVCVAHSKTSAEVTA
jgi:hypothetical protein